MKVLLWKDVEKVGNRGDVVDVAGGYARNYLLPQKIASLPTEKGKRDLELEKKHAAKQEAKTISDVKALAERFGKESVTIEVKTNEEGNLYGSVTPAMVADAYKEQGLAATPEMFVLDEHIKTAGVYTVKVKLPKEVEATAKVWVVQSREKTDTKSDKETAPAQEG